MVQKTFIPQVSNFFKQTNCSVKALLVLDNALSHPSEQELKKINSNFKVIFLPPNCTALNQPMDQKLIQKLKVEYRKQFLNHISIDQPWRKITEKNIQKSSTNLQPKIGIWDEEVEVKKQMVRKFYGYRFKRN